jgi:hypothetical protein
LPIKLCFIFKTTSFGSVQNGGGGGARSLDLGKPPDYYHGDEEVRIIVDTVKYHFFYFIYL